MKLAWFTPLRPARADVRDDVERLLPAIARDAEIALFTADDGDAFPGAFVVHDLRARHHRKLLWHYDLAVYALADDHEHDYMRDALCEWPGVVLAYEEDLEPLFRRQPELRRAVLEQALLLVVRSPALSRRLRDESPFTSVMTLAGAIEDQAKTCVTWLAATIARRRRWIEALLEAACAEIPGWLPGDPQAPWRDEVRELVDLSKPRGG